MKLLIVFLAILVLAGGGGWYYVKNHSEPKVVYKTQPVKRGELLATISSTGTVEPEEVVDIGAQVQGIVISFDKDADGKTVDYRSHVNENMVLAHIDPTLFKADEISAQAALEQAKATKELDVANLGVLQAKYEETKEDWARAEIAEKASVNVMPANDLAMYKSNFLQAQANLEVGNKTVLFAQTGVDIAQAAYDKAKANLGYCTITSPVKGVIIDRRVNIGQTVVSGLSAPSLFLVAKDLTRIQVWASVNEADIASIVPGERVTFSVDAIPNREFVGNVNKVRFNATVSQNVVTYLVEVNTPNADEALYPYMTANVHFEVNDLKDVLQIPNSAIRWLPDSADQVVPSARKKFEAMMAHKAAISSGIATAKPKPRGASHLSGASRPATGPDDDLSESPGHDRGTVWVQEGNLFRPIRVVLGKTDGTYTQVAGGDLKEGQELVVGEEAASDSTDDNTSNPFMPSFKKKK